MVFSAKFGTAGMSICTTLLFGGYVSLFHLLHLFTGVLRVWVEFHVCRIVVSVGFQLLFLSCLFGWLYQNRSFGGICTGSVWPVVLYVVCLWPARVLVHHMLWYLQQNGR